MLSGSFSGSYGTACSNTHAHRRRSPRQPKLSVRLSFSSSGPAMPRTNSLSRSQERQKKVSPLYSYHSAFFLSLAVGPKVLKARRCRKWRDGSQQRAGTRAQAGSEHIPRASLCALFPVGPSSSCAGRLGCTGRLGPFWGSAAPDPKSVRARRESAAGRSAGAGGQRAHTSRLLVCSRGANWAIFFLYGSYWKFLGKRCS